MLLEANFDAKKDAFGEVIERGSFVTSQPALAERWGWKRSRVRSFLDRLEKRQRISQHSTKLRTKIVIVNYEEYQKTKPNRRKKTAKETANVPPSESPQHKEVLNNKINNTPLPPLQGELDCQEFRAALTSWIEHRKEIKKPLTEKALSLLMKKFTEWGSRKSIAAIELAIEHGWRGVFEPSERPAAVRAKTKYELDQEEFARLREEARKADEA